MMAVVAAQDHRVRLNGAIAGTIREHLDSGLP
jgi:hypothetical protein